MKETHQARAPTVLRTGRPNREPLDTNEVIAYAIALAEQLGVSIPKRKKLYRTLKQKIPITQICQGAYYWLWIDRFYIAVQKLTDDSIRYVYLTRIHIRNELLADQRMKRLYSVSLLDLEAQRQFTAARRAMERLQTDCVSPAPKMAGWHSWIWKQPGTVHEHTTRQRGKRCGHRT